MPHPPVELFTNTSRLPTQPCAGNHPSSPRHVKACFGPAYCFMHNDNNNPQAAWAYITVEEAHLLSIARRNLWTQECLEELIARDLEARMESVSIEEAAADGESKEE